MSAQGITNFNKVILLGKIVGKEGAKIELKPMVKSNGEAVTDHSGNQLNKVDFTLSIIDKSRKKGEDGFYPTDNMLCTAIGATAKFISEHFCGQSGILVEGKLTTSSWEKDGERRYFTGVTVKNVEFNGTKVETDNADLDAAAEAAAFANEPADAAFADAMQEELPFN